MSRGQRSATWGRSPSSRSLGSDLVRTLDRGGSPRYCSVSDRNGGARHACCDGEPSVADGRPTIEHVAAGPVWRPGGDGVVRFIRFDAGMGSTYGIVEGEVVHAINGNLFSPGARTGWVHPMAAV